MMETAANQWMIENIFFARPLPLPLMLLAIGAVISWSVYLYRRSIGLSPVLRFTLGFTRFFVLSVVLAALCEPMIGLQETKTRKKTLPVLVDVSQSMGIRDPRKRPADLLDAAVALDLIESTESQTATQLGTKQRQLISSASRLDLAKNLLAQKGRATMESIGSGTKVTYHGFGSELQLVSDDSVIPEAMVKEFNPIQNQTSIIDAIEEVTSAGNNQPAGVVLLSDGIETLPSSRAESVLRDLGARGIPVFTVPLGLTDPDDVSIKKIVMQDVAYSGDRVPVRVQLHSKGYEKRTAKLSVLLNDRNVSSRTIRLEGGLQFEDIDFRVDIYEKGAVQVDVQIEPFDDEVSQDNNQATRSIRVVNEKVNVLYIEGNARWEYRYLRAILKRDPRINATFIGSNVGPEVARNSNEHIDRFPNRREDAFQYDLVILGDVDSTFFGEDELALLEELIRDRGASLLMLCGPMHSPTSYAGTPVESMLPVQFDADSKWTPIAESVYPVLTPEGRSSLVMTLENEPELNDRIWSRMAPMDHLPPLTEPKPGANVLAVLSDRVDRDQGYPLVAWQRYGTGKCMSIATDRLWRLRYKTGDKYHWRVWSQCIQFMTLSRLMGEHKRIRLETDRSLYLSGGQCRIYAHVLDDHFDPVMQPQFDVFVTALGNQQPRQKITLRPDRTHPGLYEGYFASDGPGRYRLESNENDQPISNTTEFQVTEENRELAETDLDLENLKRIAKLTGGTCLSVQDFSELEDLLNVTPVSYVVKSQMTLWDNSWILCLLIGLLGMEWIQRRRHDLA